MKIAMGQINAHIGNFQKNYDKILSFCKNAIQQEADLTVFPELALCGYPPMDLLTRDAFWEENDRYLEKLRKNLPRQMGVILGALRRPNFNTAYFFLDGEVKYQDKTLLPTYDVFDESRYFLPAEEWKVFEFKGEKLFIVVCEDIWDGYEFNPHERVKDFDILINISASPFEVHKLLKRIHLMKNICQEKKATGIYVNMCGANDELIFDGRSFVVKAEGCPALIAKRFEEDLLVADLSKLEENKLLLEEHDLQDLHDALVWGIRDYFRKTGFSRAVLGLSGGIDSAVVACLAVEALGKENVTALLMPGPYSTDHSVMDATKLSQNLGITFHVICIKKAYESLLEGMEHLFEGKPLDVTEENIQSRIRGMIQMAYANKFRALNLNTGNKSELFTGYCTLYGDMCGALSVIGDIYKTEVYQLAKYINRDREIIPQNSILKPPSAELSPGQKDQDSLPPYDILDVILYEYLEKHRDAEEIARAYDFDLELVKQVIHKIFISEYKRRQAPIVLKVSSKTFGSGRRIPISGQFK